MLLVYLHPALLSRGFVALPGKRGEWAEVPTVALSRCTLPIPWSSMGGFRFGGGPGCLCYPGWPLPLFPVSRGDDKLPLLATDATGSWSGFPGVGVFLEGSWGVEVFTGAVSVEELCLAQPTHAGLVREFNAEATWSPCCCGHFGDLSFTLAPSLPSLFWLMQGSST